MNDPPQATATELRPEDLSRKRTMPARSNKVDSASRWRKPTRATAKRRMKAEVGQVRQVVPADYRELDRRTLKGRRTSREAPDRPVERTTGNDPAGLKAG